MVADLCGTSNVTVVSLESEFQTFHLSPVNSQKRERDQKGVEGFQVNIRDFSGKAESGSCRIHGKHQLRGDGFLEQTMYAAPGILKCTGFQYAECQVGNVRGYPGEFQFARHGTAGNVFGVGDNPVPYMDLGNGKIQWDAAQYLVRERFAAAGPLFPGKPPVPEDVQPGALNQNFSEQWIPVAGFT